MIDVLSGKRRKDTFLSFYGPLSLILLLTIWALGIIIGFALITWSSGSAIRTPDGITGFSEDLYLSGTTFFTLGLGDVSPIDPLAKVITVIEPGIGLGLLALVIGYLPALNQSFSRRESKISLLDARAGSPPTAVEMLRRQCRNNMQDVLLQHLTEWERWAAELLEGHLSYPVLAYFRSQHDNQSWLSALTMILDTCSLTIAGIEEAACARQAQLTFAIARHAVVDLSLILGISPVKKLKTRLTPGQFPVARELLVSTGIRMRESDVAEKQLTELRAMYEPYVYSMSLYLRLPLPPWLYERQRRDNWQTSIWEGGTERKADIFHDDEEDYF
jgi:hypothetical protein